MLPADGGEALWKALPSKDYMAARVPADDQYSSRTEECREVQWRHMQGRAVCIRVMQRTRLSMPRIRHCIKCMMQHRPKR